MNPPSALYGAMSRDRKPFTYTPGGLDLSEIKSERMAKRLMRNAMNQGVPEVPIPQVQSPPANPVVVPNFNCLPVQVFPTFNLPANPKSLLRTRSNPEHPKEPLQKVLQPSIISKPKTDEIQNNHNYYNYQRPSSICEPNAKTLPEINNSNITESFLPEISYEAEYFQTAPRNYSEHIQTIGFQNKTDHVQETMNNTYADKTNKESQNNSNVIERTILEEKNECESIQTIRKNENEVNIEPTNNIIEILDSRESKVGKYPQEDVITDNNSGVHNRSVNVTPNFNDSSIGLDFSIEPLSINSPSKELIDTERSEEESKSENEQKEVKVVKKQVKKESKTEIQNGEQNGDAAMEAELTVKLPSKKSAAKTETKVEVVKKQLPDGSIEEIKTTTTKTTVDGKTKISTKTETTIIPKQEEDEEEVEEEEEEEEVNEVAEIEEVKESSANEVEKKEVVETAKSPDVDKKKGSITTTEERTETQTTKKVTVIKQEPEEVEEEVEEEEEEEEEEEVKVAETKPVVVEIKPSNQQPAEDEVEEDEEQVEEEVEETKQELVSKKVEAKQDQEVEEEEQEEEEEEEEVLEEKEEQKVVKTEVKNKVEVEEENEEDEVEKEVEVIKKEEINQSKEVKEDEESEYTEEEYESEKEETQTNETEQPKTVVEEPQKEPETPKIEEKKEVPVLEEKEKMASEPDKPPEKSIPLREPSIPLEKVEDVEIKPISLSGAPINESFTKSITKNTEITTTERPTGPLSTQTEYNRIENIVTVNRTTKTLDHSYEQLTQHGVPTVKTYFAPSRERVSTSPQPSKPYQPVYPPSTNQPTERRHSLLLERLSTERQMPTDIYQNYQQNTQSYEQQKQWSQEPQAEVVTVSNVKPSKITNQQWYQNQDSVIYNNVTPSTPAGQTWSQPTFQAQPSPQPQAQPQSQPQYQPSYTDNSTNSYQQNNYQTYTPKSTWPTSNLSNNDTLSSPVNNQQNQYSFLNQNSSQSYQKTTQQYSSSYVPPPWEQDASYVPDTSNQTQYQAPPPTSYTPNIDQGWNPPLPKSKYSKTPPTSYIPPAPNQSFVKPVNIVEPPKVPGKKTYYSEYERRYITVPESNYVPGESKFQPQPDPSPQYYYDNNEPSDTVEPQWRKELREFTEKSSQTQHSEHISVKPPWEEESTYAKAPPVAYTPTPSWSQTLRPRSWRERSFESEFVGSQETQKTSTLGRGRPLSSYGRSQIETIPERPRGVSVDRYNPNNYQSPIPAEHPPVQSHTLTVVPPAKSYHNPNVPAYHSSRASAEPREQPVVYQQPRQHWGDSRASPIQSRSFKYLQWITGTDN